MYIGNDLPDMSPNDIRTVALDFVNDLAPGEVLQTPTAFLEAPSDLNVGGGTDSTPMVRITNGPTILGTMIGVQISHPIANVIYRLRLSGITNQNNTPELYTHIKCEPLR
jgi:hypothetical protein